MPYYEYECESCHKNFTLEQPIMNHHVPDTCPECGSVHTVRRVFTPSPVIFKSSGFYCTDHPDNCACQSCSKKKGN